MVRLSDILKDFVEERKTVTQAGNWTAAYRSGVLTCFYKDEEGVYDFYVWEFETGLEFYGLVAQCPSRESLRELDIAFQELAQKKNTTVHVSFDNNCEIEDILKKERYISDEAYKGFWKTITVPIRSTPVPRKYC